VGFFPILIASLFSLLAFRNVRHLVRRQLSIERRRFDRQITAMILLRVVFFASFMLPYVINRMYSINTTITQANPLPFAIEKLVQAVLFSIYNLNFTVRLLIILFTLYILIYFRQISISL
jgi:hypothetical protein